MRLFRSSVPLVVVAFIGVGCGVPGATGPRTVSPPDLQRCQLPVDAAVIEGFRPPPLPYHAGHRGLSYGTRPDQPIRAVRGGVVSFAGQVAGQLYVTVALGSGRDTTYSYLSSIAVHAGDRVVEAQVLGRAGERPFQLGYRVAGRYLDPTPLVARACRWHHAVLVPVPAAGRPFAATPGASTRLLCRPGVRRAVHLRTTGRPTVAGDGAFPSPRNATDGSLL